MKIGQKLFLLMFFVYLYFFILLIEDKINQEINNELYKQEI